MSEVSTAVRRFIGGAMTGVGAVMLAVSILSPHQSPDAAADTSSWGDPAFVDHVSFGEAEDGTPVTNTTTDGTVDGTLTIDSTLYGPLTDAPALSQDETTTRYEMYEAEQAADGTWVCDASNLLWSSERADSEKPLLGSGYYVWVEVVTDADGNVVSQEGCDAPLPEVDIDHLDGTYYWTWDIKDVAASPEPTTEPTWITYAGIGSALIAVGLPMAFIPARRREDDEDGHLSDSDRRPFSNADLAAPTGISDEQEALWLKILDVLDECQRADSRDNADVHAIKEYLVRIRREWEDLPYSVSENRHSEESRAVTDSLRTLVSRSEEVLRQVSSEQSRAVALTREVISARYGSDEDRMARDLEPTPIPLRGSSTKD